MAELQKKQKTNKKNIKKQIFFQSSSQSLIIANASFKSNPSHDSKNKTDRSIQKTISMAGQNLSKYNRGSYFLFLFFSLSEMLTTQLKVYTDQNIQSEVVPLETTQTRLVSDRNITFILQ